MADDKDPGDTGAADMLDSLWAEARGVEPRAELVARVLADADAVQSTQSVAVAPEPRSGFLGRPPSWIAALGGWGGFGGVAAAGLVGLALGFWSPDMVDVISGGQIGALTGGGSSLDFVELALEIGDV